MRHLPRALAALARHAPIPTTAGPVVAPAAGRVSPCAITDAAFCGSASTAQPACARRVYPLPAHISSPLSWLNHGRKAALEPRTTTAPHVTGSLHRPPEHDAVFTRVAGFADDAELLVASFLERPKLYRNDWINDNHPFIFLWVLRSVGSASHSPRSGPRKCMSTRRGRPGRAIGAHRIGS